MFKSIVAFCLSRRAIVVFGLALFAGAGVIAYQKLNIEAYPNPTPVILEITAQAPGLSAEEMERYYTAPDRDRALHHARHRCDPLDLILWSGVCPRGFQVRRRLSTSPTRQAAIALQQNVTLPGGQTPTIQQNSTTGEIVRYQVVGPPHFGLTNLRTVQDWIVARRLQTIPGIVQVNSWGGTTKEFRSRWIPTNSKPTASRYRRC